MAAPTRKFTVLDAMVFVAATAVGLGITRSVSNIRYIQKTISVCTSYSADSNYVRLADVLCVEARPKNDPSLGWWSPGPPPWTEPWIYWTCGIGFWPGPMLAAWSLATFGLNFRDKGRIDRRPGAIVGLAVLLALAMTATIWPPLWVDLNSPSWTTRLKLTMSNWWPCYWSSLPRMAAFGVVVGWSMLAWGGRWAPMAGWHDRLGRALGAGWIAMGAAVVVSEWLPCIPRLFR